jgi:hypothetical protein
MLIKVSPPGVGATVAEPFFLPLLLLLFMLAFFPLSDLFLYVFLSSSRSSEARSEGPWFPRTLVVRRLASAVGTSAMMMMMMMMTAPRQRAMVAKAVFILAVDAGKEMKEGKIEGDDCLLSFRLSRFLKRCFFSFQSRNSRSNTRESS